jgi:hypothetical protein
MKLKSKILILMFLIAGVALQANAKPVSIIDEKPVQVKVFPNPVTEGTVSIDSELEIKRIEILSIVGQVVYSQELEPSNSVRLYLDNIQSGIYLIKLSFVNNTSNTKRIWVK